MQAASAYPGAASFMTGATTTKVWTKISPTRRAGDNITKSGVGFT